MPPPDAEHSARPRPTGQSLPPPRLKRRRKKNPPLAAPKPLTLLTLNVGSLNTNALFLLQTILAPPYTQPDVLLLQEVFKVSTAAAEALQASGYTMVSKHLPHEGKRGGVATFIRNMSVQGVDIPCMPYNTESLCSTLIQSRDGGSTTTIANLYIPPNPPVGTSTATITQEMSEILRAISKQGAEIIAGDLNARNPLWCPKEGGSKSQTSFHRGKAILNFAHHSPFRVTMPIGNTRLVSRPQSGSTPDVVLTRSHLDSQISHHPIVATNQALVAIGTDHLPLLVHIRNRTTTASVKTHRCRRIAWARVNWDEVVPAIHNQLLNSEMLPQPAAAKAHYANWHSAMTNTLNSLPQGKRRFAQAPTLTPEQQEKLSKLNSLPLTDPQARQLRGELREEIVSHLREVEDAKMSGLNGKRDTTWGKRLWAAIRSQANKVTDSTLLNQDGTPVPPRQAANAFARCFSTKHKADSPPPQQWTPSTPPKEWPASSWTITSGEVKSAIRGLRAAQAADASGTKVALLEKLPERATRVAAKMFTSFLRDSFVPREWKVADVLPIPKEGKDIHKEDGHRPVSLLLLEAKMMEAILDSRIALHLRSSEEIDLAARQCGFRAGLGGQEALIHLISSIKDNAGLHSNWSSKGAAGSPSYFTLVAAIDLSDAFCRAHRHVIAIALQRKKIPDCIIAWILEYLTDRQIRVFHDSTHSRLHECEVGFPQGGLLGPRVWNIVIDVLIAELEAHMRISNSSICPPDDQRILNCSPEAKTYFTDLRNTKRLIRAQPGWNLNPPKFSGQAAPSNDGVVFADDITLATSTYSPIESVAQLTLMINIIARWAKKLGIKISPKTKIRWIIHTNNPSQLLPDFTIEIPVGDLAIKVPPVRRKKGEPFEDPQPIKILGLWLDCRASFADHVTHISTTITRILNDLAQKISLLRPPTRKVLVDGLCMPHITMWLPIIWPTLSETQRDNLEAELHSLSRLTVQAIATSSGVACRLEAGHRDLRFLAEREILRVSGRSWTLPKPLQRLLHATTAIPGQNKNPTDGCVAAAQSPRKALIPPPTAPVQKRWLQSLGTIPPLSIGQAINRTTFAIDLRGTKKENREATVKFNREQLDTRRTPWELWTDGSLKVTKEATLSGGAWCLWHEDHLKHTGKISLGSAACSYSAEAEALRAGIFAATQTVASLPNPPHRIRVFSDSLSCLSELARGPFRQAEQWAEAIWGALALTNTSFSFFFVFSHTRKEEDDLQEDGPETRADIVDRLAKESLSTTPTTAQWARDLLRPRLNAALEAAKARDEARTPPMSRAGLEVEPSDPFTVNAPLQHLRTLYRLRTGACPEIGGYKAQEADPCKLCGVPRGKYSSSLTPAVPHIFNCPGLPPSTTTLADLWDAPKEALKRYEEYLAAITAVNNE